MVPLSPIHPMLLQATKSFVLQPRSRNSHGVALSKRWRPYIQTLLGDYGFGKKRQLQGYHSTYSVTDYRHHVRYYLMTHQRAFLTLYVSLLIPVTYFLTLYVLLLISMTLSTADVVDIDVILLLLTSCIYRDFRATFKIKSFTQFSHTAKLTYSACCMYIAVTATVNRTGG